MNVKRTTLADGEAGTVETVKQMLELIRADKNDKRIVALAQKLRKGAKTDLEFYKAVHNHIVKTIEYRADEYKGENHEVIASARYTLFGKRPYGDCDDMTIAVCTLLASQKIPCKIKICAWKPEAQDVFTHVYTLAYIKELKAWVPTDPVRDATFGQSGFGWEVEPQFKSRTFTV